jgi:alkanesulfonate monooxygenase SsuD/methylene tetrahydromethanopterin reductase-like flavin-dependent oxidoreductase (luciferase family)
LQISLSEHGDPVAELAAMVEQIIGSTQFGWNEDMKFGFTVMADIDEIGFFSHAEALGYSSVWVTDSQMLFSDCYAVLALAARQTSRLRIGPGTAICGTRIAPVQVAAMATLNRIAPGRVFLGIGTGHTAMRSMGQRPMKIAEFAEYLRVLSALLRGEVVDYTFNGNTRPVSMLMHEWKYMNLEPRIPLYVSGFGPRAMGLAGEYGDGMVFAIPPRGVPVAEALAHARQDAAPINRELSEFHSAALTSVAVLQPGEAADSDRIKEALGPNVMASVGYFYDDVRKGRIGVPAFLERIWEPYCALVEQTPSEHRHFRTHEFHYTKLHPGEAELIDAQLIRDTCLVGTPEDLIDRIRQLEGDGLQELTFATGTSAKWRLAEDFARLVMAKL